MYSDGSMNPPELELPAGGFSGPLQAIGSAANEAPTTKNETIFEERMVPTYHAPAPDDNFFLCSWAFRHVMSSARTTSKNGRQNAAEDRHRGENQNGCRLFKGRFPPPGEHVHERGNREWQRRQHQPGPGSEPRGCMPFGAILSPHLVDRTISPGIDPIIDQCVQFYRDECGQCTYRRR